jgi:DNA-binding GntR family transcriptional regulator
MRDRVYSRLQDLMADGEFRNGEHLTENLLAVRFGVSRGPVREALRMLERDGWVEWRLRRGAFVCAPSDQEVVEFFQMRRLIETEAARLAALHGAADAEATLGHIIESANGLLDANAAAHELAAKTMQFHGAIALLSGNRLLADFSERLSLQSRRLMSPIVRTIGYQAWKEHAAIAAAIGNGDAAVAQQLMSNHIEWSQRSYERNNTDANRQT